MFVDFCGSVKKLVEGIAERHGGAPVMKPTEMQKSDVDEHPKVSYTSATRQRAPDTLPGCPHPVVRTYFSEAEYADTKNFS